MNEELWNFFFTEISPEIWACGWAGNLKEKNILGPGSLAYETRQDMHERSWQEPVGHSCFRGVWVNCLFIYYAANTKL